MRENVRFKGKSVKISIGISVLGIALSPLVIPELFPKYIETIGAVQILGIAVVPSTVTMLYTSKLLSSEKSKFVLISKAISVSMLIVGFITPWPYNYWRLKKFDIACH